ncbi:MAG TPA: thioredoxin family protein [Dongiaceae bacterium]
MQQHKIVSQDEWLVARKAHLAREKEVTHLRDKVAAERRDLPWVKVDKAYVFEGPTGKQTLAQLFGSNAQLIIYHFMFGPDWAQGCPSCSFLADHIDGADQHLKHHDVSVVVVSRAPWAKIDGFKKRMGWKFNWVSSNGSDFNFDYHVSFTDVDRARDKAYYNYEMGPYMFDELPGISVFIKTEDGSIYHTYSAYARGGDILLGAHNFLDLTPKGRNENGTMDWVRHHDRYETAPTAQAACCAAESDPISEFRSRQQGGSK